MSIIVDNISYTYEIGTGFEKQALKNVKCVINDGDFIGLIGHTGSGKSTFIQHLNGLVKATSGTIYFNGMDIYDKDFDMKMLRSKVGLVFQYPEHQLFETDIFKDVCFGPKNLGLPKMDLKRCVLSGWMKICITSRRLIYRVDRKDVLRLPVCLRCARMC